MTPEETKRNEDYLIKIVKRVYSFLEITPEAGEVEELVMSEIINYTK